jgi:hypothetical protein
MRNRKSGRHEVMITAIMAPQAKLLVYYTRRDGEIVADAISFSIEDIFKNEVCCFHETVLTSWLMRHAGGFLGVLRFRPRIKIARPDI